MKTITIVGGGLAGLTLGVALRLRDVPVTIIESGSYPRHRVCGEFISGDGLRVLAELGLLDKLLTAGVHVARSVAFFSASRRLGRQPLPQPALCLSRSVLDATFAAEFVARGGNLRTNERFNLRDWPAGHVCATGRRAESTVAGWQWFGLKVHARNVSSEADLEMHLSRRAYIGVCRLPGDAVNICGLFRRRRGDPRRSMAEWWRGEPGSILHERLRHAVVDEESNCAVAGISLRPPTQDHSVVRIGDAFAMTPPITGNGMSMAFESAELACEALCQFAGGDVAWDHTCRTVAEQLERRFGQRLAWSRLLQWAAFTWPGREMAAPLACRHARFWRLGFGATRSTGAGA